MFTTRFGNLTCCVSESAASTPPFDEPNPSPGTAPMARARVHRKERSGLRNVIEWVAIIAAALIVALVIKTFLFQAFYIPSESMEPTLKPGDRVLVNKLSYDVHSIHRGDIVVFKRPPSEANDPTIKDLIKRVIAIPGDTIEARDGHVYVNGQPIKESYLPPGTITTNLPLQKIGPSQYFVMGDNRTNSKDSRYIGTIARSLIVGRAFVRVWPISKAGFF
jgi:signal peptidase I